MKRFLVIFLSVLLISPVWADLKPSKNTNLPEGVFRKTRNGEFVQYNQKGKKIGVYKIINGRFTKVK